MTVQVRAILLRVLRTVFITQTKDTIAQIMDEVTVLNMEMHILSNFTIYANTLRYSHRRFVQLNLTTSFGNITILRKAKLAIKDKMNNINKLVKPRDSHFEFTQGNTLIQVYLNNKSLTKANLVKGHHSKLTLRYTKNGLTAKGNSNKANRFVHVDTINRLNKLTNGVLIKAIHVNRCRTILDHKANVALSRRTIIITTIKSV